MLPEAKRGAPSPRPALQRDAKTAATQTAAMRAKQARAVDAALPQTQCTRCGYPDCRAYAHAIAYESAAINQCPPGGAEGVGRLAALTGRPLQALSAEHGTESPRALAVIDEAWCIGCTLCLKACPVDAIVGANKTMHTVLEEACTGCDLCVPVCPVDCISMEPISGAATGWQAWSAAQASLALGRYEARAKRMGQQVGASQAPLHQRRATAEPAPQHTAAEGGPAPQTERSDFLAGILAQAQAQARRQRD